MVRLSGAEAMRRYWVEGFITSPQFEIKGDVFHHIFEVCRTLEGHSFEILNGDGKAHLVRVEKILKKSAITHFLESRDLPSIREPKIHLVLSFPRVSTFDFILEKMVELGVYQLHPILSDYSFYHDPKHKALTKLDRWQRIILAACQQSARAQPLLLAPLSRLENKLKDFNLSEQNLGLFAYEGDSAQSFKSALVEAQSSPKKNIWLFVGSEGGFSKKEVELFAQNGLKSLSFGEQILRVETACMALVSGIKYHYDL